MLPASTTYFFKPELPSSEYSTPVIAVSLKKGYYSLMKKANITETKNHLSRLLEEVRNGTTILIMDRNRPVARLEPVAAEERPGDGLVEALVREGLAAAPRKNLYAGAFLGRKMVRLSAGTSSVQALLREREEGR
jgi:prevent-host-death family protein